MKDNVVFFLNAIFFKQNFDGRRSGHQHRTVFRFHNSLTDIAQIVVFWRDNLLICILGFSRICNNIGTGVSNFINIFSYSVDFRRDVKKGDKFEIIYENYITPDGEVVRHGDILFAALTLGKTEIELYRFEDKDGTADYYDKKGLAMKKTLSRKPMSYQNARISSPFGRRFHPIYKDYRIHWGIDYAAPKNSLVYAGGDGVGRFPVEGRAIVDRVDQTLERFARKILEHLLAVKDQLAEIFGRPFLRSGYLDRFFLEGRLNNPKS